MLNFHEEVIRHMLEAVDAKGYSPLLHQPLQWSRFNDWCSHSSDAVYVMNKASEGIETVCLDDQANLYCVAMSMETLDGIVKDLVETFEDRELERFCA